MKILLALICLVAVPFFLRFLFALISEPKPSLHGTVLRLTGGVDTRRSASTGWVREVLPRRNGKP